MAVGTHGNGAFFTLIGDAISYDGSTNPPPPNGSNFIRLVAPTLISGSVPVQYTVGNAAVTRVSVQVYNSVGQLLFRQERAYTNGTVDFTPYAAGVYFLRIMSADGKEKWVQKIVKQ